MRKIYSTLKSVVAATLVAAMTLAASCTYDDTAIKNDVEKIKTDLATLTERVAALENKLDAEVAGLKELINGKVVVTGVATEGDVTTVTLSDGSSFVIDNSKATAVAGDDYTIGAKEESGVYYWAVFVNGDFKEFLLVNGEKVAVFAEECDCEPAEACELKMEVREDGKLYVSIDGGVNWVSTELPAEQVSGACVFKGVVVNENGSVTFTLADGTAFDVAYAELVEFEAAKSAVYVKVNETISVPFAINDAVEDINVMNTPLGWKASVEEAVVVEDAEGSEDVEIGALAVGGKNYVLNITGPAKDFVKYAEKSGKVSIHFNTAAGACKVMSVDVELAEIKLDVDKAGNITIEHTMVDRYVYTDWYGNSEDVVEFNNFYFAIFDLDDYYACNGDLESVYNANWGEFNIPAVAAYINNFFTNVGENDYTGAIYEEGVNEKWTLNFTVEEVIDYLDWYESFVYEGSSFAVCVLPTDVNNNAAILWDEAIVVPFKQLSLKIEENVDNRTFQQPYFNVAFRGAEKYFFYPQTKSSLENYVEWGYYEDIYGYFAEALSSYMQYPDWYSFGYEVTTDIIEENISLAELISYSDPYNYFETIPAAEYVMAYFAWEDGKTEYTAEDLKYIEFATADLVKADPEMEVTYELDEEYGLYTIAVNVTVPEETAVAYTVWMSEEPADEESFYETIMSDGYSRDLDNGYTFYVGTSCSNPETTKYLGVLVIDAEGNYTLKCFELKSAALVINEAEVTIESVEFTETSATITVGGVEDLDVKGYQYYIISKTSGGSYYMRTEEQLADIAYGSNYMYKSSEVNPIVATTMSDYKSTFVEGEIFAVAVGVEFADGSFSKPVYGEFSYGEVVEVEVENLEMECVRAKFASNKLQLYTSTADKEGLCLVLYCYNIVDTNKMYFPAGSYSFGSSYGTIYCYGYSYLYDYSVGKSIHTCDAGTGAVVVSEVDGKYRVEVECMFDEGTVALQTVYEGAIENLILPSQFKEPEKLDFTPVRAEYDFKFDLYEYNGGDAEYAFWLYDANDNALEVICRFGSHTNWDYKYESTYYGQDGTTFTANKVATQQPNTYNCEDGQLYFVVTATSTDYEVSYSGQLAATEVNYLGEGSTYPF